MLVSTKLWVILVCFHVAKSDLVGMIKISGVFEYSDSDPVICLGSVFGNSDTVSIIRCTALTGTPVGLLFQDNEMFSHLIILDRKSWEKMNPGDEGSGIANTLEARWIKDYAILPVLSHGYEGDVAVLADNGTPVTIILECIQNHYGSRCMQFCDQTTSNGRYRCHSRTGEKICTVGWRGKNCSEKDGLKTNANLEHVQHRPKRSDCTESSCPQEEVETISPGTVEMDYRGAESLTYCDGKCDLTGTDLCILNEEDGHVCKCKHGYYGERCSEMDKCALELCLNGAECQNFEDKESMCVCPNGYSGNYCESKIDHCLKNPCGEFGECESDVTGFRCTCDAGYEGENCEINTDDCAADSCFGHGECYDGINSYDCVCYDGYFGPFCEQELNGCENNPCENGGNCSSEGMYFECQCPDNYEGLTCSEVRVDPCESDPCNGRGICYTELEEDPSESSYKRAAHCSCDPGFIGSYCELSLSFCDAPGACPSNSTCLNLDGEFMCACPHGYQGEFCEEECEDCEHLSELRCKNDPCRNGARCVAVGEDVRCICKRGFYGSRCDYEVNYCLQHSCAHGICQSTGDGFKCLCNEGWTGDRCDQDLDECGNSVNLCKNEAECINLIGGYRCNCPKGFAGELCEMSIDACSQNPCHNGGTCREDEEYSYICYCEPGYAGIHCEKKVPCENNPCLNDGECELKPRHPDQYKCLCKEGFYGRHCDKKIHACTVKITKMDGSSYYVPRTDCGNFGICKPQEIGGGFECKCLDGYQGPLCDQKIRTTECKEPYCVCGPAIPNRKSLSQRNENEMSCIHPSYGSGTCSKSECVSKECRRMPQLVCQYHSQCPDKDVSFRVFSGRYEVCTRIWITFGRNELPEDTTTQGICEKFRRTNVLSNVMSVSTKCFMHTQTDTISVITVSFEGRLKFNAQNVREKFLAYLKNLISTNNFTEITDMGAVRMLQAIKSVTDGRSVTEGGKRDPSILKPNEPMKSSQSGSTLIISVVCVAAFLLVVLFVVVFFWLKKRKPAVTSTPLTSHGENNNVPIDSVKYSKQTNGKVNPLYCDERTDVFYVDKEGTKHTPNGNALECNGREATNGVVKSPNDVNTDAPDIER